MQVLGTFDAVVPFIFPSCRACGAIAAPRTARDCGAAPLLMPPVGACLPRTRLPRCRPVPCLLLPRVDALPAVPMPRARAAPSFAAVPRDAVPRVACLPPRRYLPRPAVTAHHRVAVTAIVGVPACHVDYRARCCRVACLPVLAVPRRVVTRVAVRTAMPAAALLFPLR